MPYKSERLPLKDGQKRSQKLTIPQRQIIFEEYATGCLSQRKLAAKYGVSRRLIQFIVDPSKKARNYELRVLNGGSKQYYNKDKQTKATRETRRYKQELYLKGELNG